MRRVVPISLAVLAAVLLLIQLWPVSRDNPSVGVTVAAPAKVMTVLRRSCFDCHSHETDWPWYSHVAPVSWLVADDVHEGREHLNFSTWQGYSLDERADLFDEIGDEVGEGEMPLPLYLWVHREAELSAAERELILDWAEAGEAAADAAEETERRAEAATEPAAELAAEAAEDGGDGPGRGRGRGRGRGGDRDSGRDSG